MSIPLLLLDRSLCLPRSSLHSLLESSTPQDQRFTSVTYLVLPTTDPLWNCPVYSPPGSRRAVRLPPQLSRLYLLILDFRPSLTRNLSLVSIITYLCLPSSPNEDSFYFSRSPLVRHPFHPNPLTNK